MVFHLGLLQRLAERGLLERVSRISSVSGGSLLVGLMFQSCGFRWPSSQEFLAKVLPSLRQKLCTRSLQIDAARQLLDPRNFRFLLSRANLLDLALREQWGVRGTLSDLPQTPEWSINGTTAENGKRFRFKWSDIGDYTLGYATAANFALSTAMAVSAAFPGGFGPLSLDARSYSWRRRPWDAPAGAEQPVESQYRRLHLYDGGVYDNLGLESLFDAGRGAAKHPGEYIIASDAGAPLAPGFRHLPVSPFRLKRVADIMSDQARALRVRTFANYLQSNPDAGAYVYIGTPILSNGIPTHSSTFASSFPTTLRRLNLEDFDTIRAHGYQVTTQVETQYGLCGNCE